MSAPKFEKINELAVLKRAGRYFYPQIATKAPQALGGIVLGGEPRTLAVGSKIVLIGFVNNAVGGGRILARAEQSHRDSHGRVHHAWYAWLSADDYMHRMLQENPLSTGGKALIGAGIVGAVVLAGIGVAYAMQKGDVKKAALNLANVKERSKNREQPMLLAPIGTDEERHPIIQLKPEDHKRLIVAYVGDKVVTPVLEAASGSGYRWHAEAEGGTGSEASSENIVIPMTALSEVRGTRAGQAGPIDTFQATFTPLAPGFYEFGAILQREGDRDWASTFGVGLVVPPARRS